MIKSIIKSKASDSDDGNIFHSWDLHLDLVYRNDRSNYYPAVFEMVVVRILITSCEQHLSE